MITFEAFLVRLAQGQLRSTSAVDTNKPDAIAKEYYSKLLNLTNQGLVDLSTRFKLITKQIDLVFQTSVLSYPLNDDSDNLDYLDASLTEDFLTTNFIKITDIIDANGDSHPYDTNGHIVTPTYNTLRFTAAKILEFATIAGTATNKIRINYQAKFPTIAVDDSIDLPPNLETALQLFVSSLYFSHGNSAEMKKTGDDIWAMYLRHVGDDQRQNNSSTSEVVEDKRFDDRGFV